MKDSQQGAREQREGDKYIKVNNERLLTRFVLSGYAFR